MVSIALQLPESEARDVPNARLTDKFPSSTTLWLVLRKFEAGVAGQAGGSRNFTARGVPSKSPGASGAGRLYYEQPVLQVMNRELASFTDLQKSLAQLGLNSGTALLRLSFRTTETPLEEAMAQIQGYFDSGEALAIPQSHPQEQTASTEPSTPVETQTTTSEETPPETTPLPHEEPSTHSSPQPEPTLSATSRPVSVFRPPSSSTPSAALMSHNDADYTPTVEHAQVHQRHLLQNSRNVRLPTEAELAAQANEEAAKWAAVKEVEIKIRFPDQSAVSAKFGPTDTAADLYDFIRECLEEKWRLETFVLRNPGVRGKTEVISDDAGKTLIRDFKLKGRVLVIFGWDDNKASIQARSTKSILKEELRAQAQELKVQDVAGLVADEKDDQGVRVNIAKKENTAEEGKTKLPKWLKGFSKK